MVLTIHVYVCAQLEYVCPCVLQAFLSLNPYLYWFRLPRVFFIKYGAGKEIDVFQPLIANENEVSSCHVSYCMTDTHMLGIYVLSCLHFRFDRLPQS